MLRLFDHMVVSGANCFLLAKLCQKENFKKQKLKKKKQILEGFDCQN